MIDIIESFELALLAPIQLFYMLLDLEKPLLILRKYGLLVLILSFKHIAFLIK